MPDVVILLSLWSNSIVIFLALLGSFAKLLNLSASLWVAIPALNSKTYLPGGIFLNIILGGSFIQYCIREL